VKLGTTLFMQKIDLTTLFLSISSAAYMGMGLPIQEGDRPKTSSQDDLNLAKQNIELLELLQEKTSGNRTAEESTLIEQLLFELRMRFLEISGKGSA